MQTNKQTMTDKQIDKQDVKTRRDKQTMHTRDKQTNKPPERQTQRKNRGAMNKRHTEAKILKEASKPSKQ